ncbi:ABC transporter permease subunit, partial [Blastococcus sp. CCUG 61487]|uniref:ABC transporter permease n=1 Tax=Blastococcus sp. CCUG 61487 TaxID=1840703 RepID=UPI0010C134C4
GSSGEVDIGRLVAAAGTSLGYATAGAALTVVVALPVGLLAGRHPGRAAGAVEAASWLPRAVPAVVVAISLIYLTIRHAPGVYLTPGLLVACYAVLFLPLAVGAIRASAAQAPAALEEVARSLGHGPAAVLRRVTLPLTAPGLAAGALLVFLSCLKELTATLILHPTGTETLALRLWATTEVGRYAAAAPYAALLVLLAVVPSALLIWRQSSRG